MEHSKVIRVLKPHGNHFIPSCVYMVRYIRPSRIIGLQRHGSTTRSDRSEPGSDISDQPDKTSQIYLAYIGFESHGNCPEVRYVRLIRFIRASSGSSTVSQSSIGYI
jgi:hypothetical protein